MNETVYVFQVKPEPTHDEISAITTALDILWPECKPIRASSTDKSWRFSRRYWRKQM